MRAVLASDRLQMDGKTQWFAYVLFDKVTVDEDVDIDSYIGVFPLRGCILLRAT